MLHVPSYGRRWDVAASRVKRGLFEMLLDPLRLEAKIRLALGLRIQR